MDSLKLRLLLIGAVFIGFWSVIVWIVYPWIDSQAWLIPPIALIIPISMYSLVGFFFSFGLVGFDPQLTFHSIYLGIVEALGLLALDGLEPPLTVAPNGALNTSALGWRADLLTTLHYTASSLGVPQQYLFFIVVLGLIAIWAIVVMLATREIVKEWMEGLM